MQYGYDQLAFHNGVIEQGAARLKLDGSAQLQDGALTDHSPFQLDVSLRDADVSDLQKTVGTEYPVKGVVNLNLQASGTKADPHGRGSVSISRGRGLRLPGQDCFV